MLFRSWVDAAYLAERILTVDELKAYVDAAVPDPGYIYDRSDDPPYVYSGSEDTFFGCARCHPEVAAERLRWLLARRLVRVGRYEEALAYAPMRHHEKFEGLWQAVAAGETIDIARRMRVDGLEVAGTELDPDFAIYGGSYALAYGADRMARTDALAPTGRGSSRGSAPAGTSPARRPAPASGSGG